MTAAATSHASLDAAVAALQERKSAWAGTSIPDRIELLKELTRSFLAISGRWAAACIEAEGLDPVAGHAEEVLVGPYFVVRNLRLLRLALEDVARFGRPRIPGSVRTRPDGQVTARVFPYDIWDRIFYAGVTADVWMQPGITAESLPSTQAVAYRGERQGGVALVLGAGNVSSIGPMDALYKLFVEDQVVLYKAHPVNVYLGPLLEEGLKALVTRGFLKIGYGGAEEGAYLCQHPGVDEIHITGSDRTYEAIVFGPGEEGRRRKESNQPLLAKRVTAELGNVSPVIVVPGPPGTWGSSDLSYQAENLVTMLVNNAGFNCNATRVIIQHATSPQRNDLLAAMRTLLQKTPLRRAWYPGAADRWAAFAAAHPEAENFGTRDGDRLPWTLIHSLDSQSQDDICYTTEAFCGVFAETPIAAPSVSTYLDQAVAFANETLWGTLNATLIVHPAALRDREIKKAVEKAIATLRYGTVSVNHWAAIGYGLVITPWGAFPGHSATDIQSGTGVVHNTLMFDKAQKTVVRAPFRVFPKPVWFASHKTAHKLTPKLVEFEADPSFVKLPGILGGAVRG
ncbi:MAG TPA: aldehyde dehydrogenase family protein [Thermoanaerobaculia bacterium]|jgi:acyl-CoA reductase-like NAD-dependent aldehyde dehydrogenase|nr:aldehyde dehydrogenase family protein [Thermoanaerobaculia bacterium]